MTKPKHKYTQLYQAGFTIIELVLVMVIIGILSAFALPKFSELSSSAKVATIESVAGSMRATIGIIRSKAYVQGLSIQSANPGDQSALLVTTEAGTSEVDWRNLCPESRAELGDSLQMSDHISFENTGDLTVVLNNQFTKIGYNINSVADTVTGCFVLYDSFGDPNCEVKVVTNQC